MKSIFLVQQFHIFIFYGIHSRTLFLDDDDLSRDVWRKANIGVDSCGFRYQILDTKMIHNFEGYEGYPHIGIDSIEKETGRLVGYRTIADDGVVSGKYLFTPAHIIYSKNSQILIKWHFQILKGCVLQMLIQYY